MSINKSLMLSAMAMALAASSKPMVPDMETKSPKQSFTSKRKQEAHQQRMRKKGR